MEFTAKARYMRVSPQKARLVLGLIKGKRVEDGAEYAGVHQQRHCAAVLKLLRSALENANYLSAEKGLDVDLDNLYVKNAMANEGPRMKRIRPAPMGRAYRYQRRMAHIEIALAEKKQEPKGALAAAAEKPAKKRRPRSAGQESRRQEGAAKKSGAKKK